MLILCVVYLLHWLRTVDEHRGGWRGMWLSVA